MSALARMSPANAAVRFGCELVALYGIGAGAWSTTGSVVLTAGLPLIAATLWGVFRVPDDPGPPPVEVPGVLRLLLEGAVFVGGVLGLWAAHGLPAASVFAAVVGVHYATSPARVRYVLSCRGWGRPG